MRYHLANLSRLLFASTAWVLAAGPCQAQTRGNVTVQLPTFHQFGVATSVIVPDRGSIYLGGAGHSSLGQSQTGLPRSTVGGRSLGRSSSAVGLSVSATIIDHNEHR